MLRRTLLSLSENSSLRHWMEHSRLSRKLTARFVAGSALEDGIGVLKELRAEQILGTLDFLGENVTSLDEAAQSRDAYLRALEEIQRAGLSATVSIKLTQFGLDFSKQACCQNVQQLLERARHMNTRIEIDMESSQYTDRTIEILLELQEHYPGHVRGVLQAYLYRSETDIRVLSARQIPIRLCKGAYREPATVAFPRKA